MANEQNPPVRPSRASLHLRDKDGEKAREAVVQGIYVLALAGGVPQRGPRVIDLGEVCLEGVRGRWARMETCPGFDGRVPLRQACVEEKKRFACEKMAFGLSSPCSTYIGNPNAIDVGLDVCRQRSGRSNVIERVCVRYSGLCLTVRGGEYRCGALVFG